MALVAAFGTAASVAHAKKTNASAAAGFVEDAQNKDGGFGAKKGKGSDTTASLWASVALLAAGKNPRDEYLKDGKSAEQYLVAHKSSYDSLEELGLLAIIQSGAHLGATNFGNPVKKLRGKLTAGAVGTDPRGAAIAIFGLLQEGSAASKALAASTARTLLTSKTSDGGWGLNGNADSPSTALVLQALAKTGVANGGSPEVQSGLAYLHQAQGNDGAIVEATRFDKATHHGDVASTAFTQQAITALGAPTLKTSGGKTVKQGLAQYQQEASGGLASSGSQYNQSFSPSVVETAQAFPAFDGKTFPLRAVAARTHGPPTSRSGAKGTDNSSNRVSQGTAAQGLSGTDPGATGDPGAFAGGSADGNNQPSSGQSGSSVGKAAGDIAKSGSGTSVSGTVVGTGPKLAAKAGASDTGLTNQQRATIGLAVLMAMLFAFGAVAERQRPGAAGVKGGVIAVGGPVLRWSGRASGVTATRKGESLPPRRRWPLVAMLAVGVGLIAVPVTTHMSDRAPQGAKLISAFKPYMQPTRVESFKQNLHDISSFSSELAQRTPALLYPGQPPAQGHEQLLKDNGQVALFDQQWPEIQKTFDDLISRIEKNEGNYQAVASLPSFTLFPWFFLIPGGLLAFLGIAGLLFGRNAWLPLRRAALALGVALVIAPIVFQLYTRAPKGDDMVKSFKQIENRATVQKVQGGFSTITLGHGAIDAELVPALKQKGLTDRQIAQQLPGTNDLNTHWVKILNNMTPMIGAMNDNVGNYQAVAALPPFTSFIWLFLIPGLLVVGLVLLAGTKPRESKAEARSSEPVTT